jgi:short-subunit dehydrogenase
MDTNSKGKVLITGASPGIGAALPRQFLRPH